MPVHVVIEYSPACPRCRMAERVLRRICDELSVPLVVRRVGSEVPVLGSRFTKHPTSIHHTFTEEFARRQGRSDAASAIAGLRRAGIDPSELTTTPVIRIVYSGVRGRREIIIRGFPLSRENVERAAANIYALLKALTGGR